MGGRKKTTLRPAYLIMNKNGTIQGEACIFQRRWRGGKKEKKGSPKWRQIAGAGPILEQKRGRKKRGHSRVFLTNQISQRGKRPDQQKKKARPVSSNESARVIKIDPERALLCRPRKEEKVLSVHHEEQVRKKRKGESIRLLLPSAKV